MQGATRGFLVIRSDSGKLIANGELTQLAHGSNVTTRLTYTFLDGSLDDDTTTYSQRGVFRLIRDHHIQKGPFFNKSTDTLIEASTGTVTTRTWNKHSAPEVKTEHVDLPEDIANGFVGTLLLNLPANAAPFKTSMLTPSGSKSRVVKLAISGDGQQSFHIAGRQRTASVFRVHIELGGMTGAIAPMIGKEPKDVMVWVIEGEAPALVREICQMSEGGPVVSVELAGATFPTAR